MLAECYSSTYCGKKRGLAAGSCISFFFESFSSMNLRRYCFPKIINYAICVSVNETCVRKMSSKFPQLWFSRELFRNEILADIFTPNIVVAASTKGNELRTEHKLERTLQPRAIKTYFLLYCYVVHLNLNCTRYCTLLVCTSYSIRERESRSRRAICARAKLRSSIKNHWRRGRSFGKLHWSVHTALHKAAGRKM